MSLQSFVTIKKPTCKVMILDVFKNSGKSSITTSEIISEIEKKYEYKNKAPIKTALKKLMLDSTVVNCEVGPLGSLKINVDKVVEKPVSKNSKNLQAAKKTTATAKRALKKNADGGVGKKTVAAKKPAKPKPKKNCMSDKLYKVVISECQVKCPRRFPAQIALFQVVSGSKRVIFVNCLDIFCRTTFYADLCAMVIGAYIFKKM